MKAAAIVLAWIALAHPDPSALDRARFHAIADGIAFEAARTPLSVGADRTALLLAAIAEHEGGLRESVRRCAVTGDQGRAVTLFQLHPEALGGIPREVACSDDRVAARLALAALRAGERVCHGDLRCAVRLYASGRRSDTKAAREIIALWKRLGERRGHGSGYRRRRFHFASLSQP